MFFYGKKITENVLVSVIIDTFYRPEMLKNAVEKILHQTYQNIELIIVDNGSTIETKNYLKKIKEENHKIKIIRFENNQFSWDDPHKLIRICYNAGLENANGDLIFYQSDDDWVNFDFIEKMVYLFIRNEKCTTAIGRVVNCLYNGKIINMYDVRERPVYLNGYDLAIDYLKEENKLIQPNPGHSFVIKKDILLKYGGFQDTYETHQMLGIVPFGQTGFDKTALMFWGRSSEKQLNVQMNKLNFFWGRYYINNIINPEISLIKNWKLHFSKSDVILLENYLNHTILSSYYKVIITNFFNFRKSNKFNNVEIEYIENLTFNIKAFSNALINFYKTTLFFKVIIMPKMILNKLFSYYATK
jgi:glycosyltransferase involved in cell wall biosynthesis